MRLGETASDPAAVPGVRVLVDVRPLGDPERAPATATYLRGLLGAFAAEPVAGESFVILLDLGADDPADLFPGLPVVGKRRLPITRVFRSGALTLDPFLVRGASLGAGRGLARETGAAGAVAHAVAGALPIAPGLPVVATLLDVAPWELPEQYQRSPAARFGQRLRAQLLREADVVIVGSAAVARSATRLLRIRPGRLRVVPLAGGDAFAPFSMAGTEVGDAQRAALAADARAVWRAGALLRLHRPPRCPPRPGHAARRSGPPRRRRAAAPPREGRPVAAADPAGRHDARRSRGGGPGRVLERRRRAPALCAGASRRPARQPRRGRSCRRPPGRERGGRPAGPRRPRRRHARDRERRWRPAGGRRAGRPARRAARRRSPGPRAPGGLGRRSRPPRHRCGRGHADRAGAAEVVGRRPGDAGHLRDGGGEAGPRLRRARAGLGRVGGG